MAEERLTAKERVEQEQFELIGKVQKLMLFLFSDKGRALTPEGYNLLRQQFGTMIDYLHILNARLIAWQD